MKKRRVKKRIKTNIYFILLILLFESLPIIDVLNNNIITLIYIILQFIIINILYKRILEEN